MKILVVKSMIPASRRAGTDVVSYNLLRLLSLDHSVSFLGIAHSQDELEGAEHLKKLCEEVHALLAPNKRSFLHRLFYKIGYYALTLTGQSLEVSYNTPRCLRKKLREMTSAVQYDLVLIEYWHNARLESHILNGARPVLLIHDAAFVDNARRVNLEENRLKRIWLTIHHRLKKREELRSIRLFEDVFALSSADVRHILREDESLRTVSFRTIPTSVVESPEEIPSIPANVTNDKSIYFIGNLNRFNNFDAAYYFLEAIYPHLVDLLGNVDFTIIGKHTPRIRTRLTNLAPVHLKGFVDDIWRELSTYRICVTPLRIGSGIKIKNLEAFMIGKPVVTTSVGAEGIDFFEEHRRGVQDRPADFAAEIARLLTDRDEYDEVRQLQAEYALNHLTIESNRKPMSKILEDLASTNPG